MPGVALEEQAAARRAAHLAGEGLVREEEVQRADHVLLDRVDADDVVEPDLDLLRPVHHVRRPAGEHELAEEHDDQQQEEQRRDQQQRVDRRQVEQVERVAAQDAVPEVRRRDADHEQRASSSRLRRMSSRLRPTSAVACRARPVDRRPSVDGLRAAARPAPPAPPSPAPSCACRPQPLPGRRPRPSERRRRSPERRINPGPPSPIHTAPGGRASAGSLTRPVAGASSAVGLSPVCEAPVTRSAQRVRTAVTQRGHRRGATQSIPANRSVSRPSWSRSVPGSPCTSW